jgi:beta-glucosidase
MRIPRNRFAVAALLSLGLAACSEETKVVTVPVDRIVTEVAACSTTYPTGACDAGQSCFQGACVASATLCSAANVAGACQAGYACYHGGCIPTEVVPPQPPVDPADACAVRVNTVQPVLGFAPARPLGEGGAAYTYDHDGDSATAAVEVPYAQKAAITVDGLQFRDLNGNGLLEKYEDWRYSDLCRAKDLAARMTVKQKVGLMSESSSIGGGSTSGVLAQNAINSVALDQRRQALIRFGNITPAQYATYLNNVQALCEGLPLGIPFVVTADPVHGIGQSTNATSGNQTRSSTAAVSHWPYPLGLGAINDAEVTFRYGDTVRKEFKAMGFRWQLGPMADLGTEPRWARVQNVFGENAFHVAKHTKACIEGFQAGREGGLRGGIAATMKHFPGAGPDEDGKDSHRSTGKWNVFPGDNFEYHQIPFRAAIEAGSAAVMPCYSIFKGQTDFDPEQVGAAFSKGLITDYLKDTLGFDGMVTGDWGTVNGGSPHGVEALTVAERAAKFVTAGSHQLGSDSHAFIQAAYDQGLLVDADVDGAAAKILEMSFKLGIFENPYSDPEVATATVRSEETLTAGFEAQKKALVLLRNNGAARLPISQSRFSNVTGGTANPEVGEFGSDADRDGQIEVFYDGVADGLSGADPYSTFLLDYDYAATGTGASGEAGFTLPIVQAASAAEADIAVLRITARKGTYFGLDAGVPLSFDKPFPGLQNDGGYAAAVKDRNKVIDLFRIRDGYVDSTGAAVAATNPSLKIVLVMHMDRPGIVKPFVNGLRTLDETPGEAGSYPLVSDQANVNQAIVTTTTASAHAGVDVFMVDFGAYDRAVLDFLFNKNPIAGWTYGQARLPMEIPSSDEEVDAQYEDLPADSWSPTFTLGAGSNLPSN